MEYKDIADEEGGDDFVGESTDSAIENSVVKDPEVLIRKTMESDFDLGVEMLFRSYYALLCNHAVRFVASREIAEDIVSDVFSACYTTRRFYEIQNSYRAYLFNAVRNRAFNFVKSELQRNTSLDDVKYVPVVADAQPDELIHYEEMYHDVERAIDRLAPKRRSVYIMRRIEGKNYEDIASELNISLKTVKEHMYQALKQIRSQLSARWS